MNSSYLLIISILLTLSIVALIAHIGRSNRINFDTKRLLELTAAELNEQRMQNIHILQDAIKQRGEVNAMVKYNVDILNQNDKTLKKQIVELYHIKESAIFLYDNYREAVSILSSKLLDEYGDKKDLATVYHNAVNNLNFVENYFINTFKMHPDAYKQTKKNITGSNENGANWLSQSSIN